MEIVAESILQKIIAEAGKDPQHQQFLSLCRELEDSYSRVMESLSAESREVIDAYFLACCQMQLDLLRVAYQCGTQGMFPQYPKF